MTDYKYLKQNNLFEAHMRFMRALGEGYGYNPMQDNHVVEEDGEDDPNMGGAPMDDPNAGGAPMGDPNMGGAPTGDPNAGGAPMGDPNMGGAPAGDPNAGMPPMDDPNAGGASMDDPDAGMPPMDDPNAGMPPMDDPNEQNDVIDVEDITNAEEKVNKKVNSIGKDVGKVDDKIQKLIATVNKLGTMFDRNNQEIESLKKEFEKRNPTQTEKLNLRSLDSYPFNVKPTSYWDKKMANSNYSIYGDNQEPTTKEYIITNNDVDDFNEREIADSFAIDDDIANLDIKKIFGL